MKEEILPNATYTTEEAAGLLNLDKVTIQRMIRRNDIRAVKAGRVYIIPGRSLLEFLGLAESIS